MNKKSVKTGPRIRITRPAYRLRKPDDPPLPPLRLFEDRSYVYSCQYCRLKFTQNSQYFRHMTSNHEAQQKLATFECNECKLIFSKKSNLDHHCQTQHQVKSKSRCESCAITFKSRYCLKRHLKLKQLLQDNACVMCQKKFTSKDFLAKHIKSKHTFKNVIFQCNMCSLKFKVRESLQSHIQRIHKRL